MSWPGFHWNPEQDVNAIVDDFASRFRTSRQIGSTLFDRSKALMNESPRRRPRSPQV